MAAASGGAARMPMSPYSSASTSSTITTSSELKRPRLNRRGSTTNSRNDSTPIASAAASKPDTGLIDSPTNTAGRTAKSPPPHGINQPMAPTSASATGYFKPNS